MSENIKLDSYDKPKLVKQDNLKDITFDDEGWQGSLGRRRDNACKDD